MSPNQSMTESMDEKIVVDIREAIDTVEEAYEFMLAYAAQGRQTESETEGASQIRGFLDRFRNALNVFSNHSDELLTPAASTSAFAQHFAADTNTMKAVLDMLIGKSNITSDMIDNTNGMIVVRSFLTNVFFVDQVMLPQRDAS